MKRKCQKCGCKVFDVLWRIKSNSTSYEPVPKCQKCGTLWFNPARKETNSKPLDEFHVQVFPSDFKWRYG